MGSVLREGFWRDLLVALAVTVALIGAASGLVAALVDAAFGDAVDQALGELGGHDVIVHVREEARAPALAALGDLLADHLPGTAWQEGIRLAGNVNLFLTFPEDLEGRRAYEEFPRWISQLPGFNGFTWILEPSLTVGGLLPGVRDLLLPRVEALPGVALAFRHETGITAVLAGAERAPAVARALEELLAGYRVLEVHVPEGAPAPGRGRAREILQAAFGEGQVVAEVSPQPEDAGPAAVADTLRGLLLPFAPRAGVELAPGVTPPGPGRPVGLVIAGREEAGPVARGRIEEARAGFVRIRLEEGTLPAAGDLNAHLLTEAGGLAPGESLGPATVLPADQRWHELAAQAEQLAAALEGAAAAAQEAAARVEAALGIVEAAATELAALRAQVAEVRASLEQGRGGSGTSQVLAALLLGRLLASQGGEGTAPAGPGPVADLDPGAVRAAAGELDALAAELGAGRATALAEGLAEAAASLPAPQPAEVLRALTALGGAGPPGRARTAQVLVRAGLGAPAAAAALRRELGGEVRVYESVVGAVHPNPRATLLNLLGRTRQVVAGLVAVLLATLALALDQSTFLSGLGQLRAVRRGPRWRSLPAGPGTLLGALLWEGAFLASGAGLGGGTPAWVHGLILAGGAGTGLVVGLLAHRLSPVRAEEVEAGQALGLSGAEILREIVLPVGRPGILAILNRPRRRLWALREEAGL